jgi:hypothetical protein
MQYIMWNNVHPYFLCKLNFVELTTPHIVAELSVHISVTQFVSTTNTLQGAWLVNDVMVNEVCDVHLQNPFLCSLK